MEGNDPSNPILLDIYFHAAKILSDNKMDKKEAEAFQKKAEDLYAKIPVNEKSEYLINFRKMMEKKEESKLQIQM